MNILRTVMIAIPEKRKEVLQTILSLVELQGKDNGCLSYGVYSDIKDEDFFNLISEWENRRNLEHYIMSFKFKVLLGTKSLLREPITMKIFKVSDSEGIDVINSARKKMKLIYPVLTRNVLTRNVLTRKGA
nr:antibiotic biosynthesis monooxygenase [Desulfobulbaceae bacterium]